MKVTWQVEDGYAGPSRPQTTKIDDGDITDCETESEVRTLIEDRVQEAFEQNIYPSVSESDIDDVIDFWREMKAEEKD